MSQICQGSFTCASASPIVIALPSPTLTPIFMEFEIGPRVSTVENRVMRSSGWQDFTNNRKAAMSIYDDATVRGTAETTTYSITHYNNVSGVFTEIISGYASSPVAGQFTYNPTLFNASYEIRYKAFSA